MAEWTQPPLPLGVLVVEPRATSPNTRGIQLDDSKELVRYVHAVCGATAMKYPNTVLHDQIFYCKPKLIRGRLAQSDEEKAMDNMARSGKQFVAYVTDNQSNKTYNYGMVDVATDGEGNAELDEVRWSGKLWHRYVLRRVREASSGDVLHVKQAARAADGDLLTVAKQPRVAAKGTMYGGYAFKSRLEARHAVFFDALGVRWLYENINVTYGEDKEPYMLDFTLPDLACCVEVKPTPPSEQERFKVERVCLENNRAMLIIYNSSFEVPFYERRQPDAKNGTDAVEACLVTYDPLLKVCVWKQHCVWCEDVDADGEHRFRMRPRFNLDDRAWNTEKIRAAFESARTYKFDADESAVEESHKEQDN